MCRRVKNAGQYSEYELQIFHITSNRAKSVQARRAGHHSIGRPFAVSQLQANHSTETGWPVDRSTGLRTQGQRNHPTGHRGARSARRSTWRAFNIPRIQSRWRINRGELGGHGFTQWDQTRLPHFRHNPGIICSDFITPGFKASHGGPAGHVDDILDAYRDSVETA